MDTFRIAAERKAESAFVSSDWFGEPFIFLIVMLWHHGPRIHS